MKLWEMVSKKYHKDIGFPEGVTRPLAGYRLSYSHHAAEEATKDGLSLRELPLKLPADYTLVEVSAIGKDAVKWVVRFALPTKPGWDIVMVIGPTYHVSTVYINHANDHHPTLRKERYTAITSAAAAAAVPAPTESSARR